MSIGLVIMLYVRVMRGCVSARGLMLMMSASWRLALSALNVLNCNDVKRIVKTAVMNIEEFLNKYCGSKPAPELFLERDPKDGEQGEHGTIEEVSIVARKDGDGFIVCAEEHNCVRIRSCESSHLARAIRLLVIYLLSRPVCLELFLV